MSGKDGAPGYTPSLAGAYPPRPGSVVSGYEPSLSGGYDNRASMMMPYGAPPPMAYAYPNDNRLSMLSATNYSAPVPRAGYAQPPSGSASPRPIQKMAPVATHAAAVPHASSKEPTDEQLLTEIKGILATANLMTLTKKQVREDLSVRFGDQDLKHRRATINAMIDAVLQGM